MKRRLIAIVNSAAGPSGNAPVADILKRTFAAAGIDARIDLAHDGQEVAALARSAVGERPDILVAGGGDGTLNVVASAVVGMDITLGVIPLGTLNHFAKALGIPAAPADAARSLIENAPIRVDVGEVNGRIFLNNSSLGLYPSLVRRRERQQENLGRNKWAAAAWAALTLLRRHALLNVRIDLHGERIERRTAIVFVGNNAYRMSGLRVGERERLDGGQLGLYLPHRGGRRGLFLLGLRAACGRLREARDFDALFAQAIDIDTHHEYLPVAIDGEVALLRAPLRFRIRPGALRVIAPTPSVASQ